MFAHEPSKGADDLVARTSDLEACILVLIVQISGEKNMQKMNEEFATRVPFSSSRP
jgi:hypothetical protein